MSQQLLANNSAEYQRVFATPDDKYHFYQPTNIAQGYHHSRYVEAVNIAIYAKAGATKEVIQTIAEEIVTLCNNELRNPTLRTDVALLANQLLYRTKYPVDQHCAIRQGAVLCFMVDNTNQTEENPKTYSAFWQQRKEELAFAYPELYDFFLTLGISNIEEYKTHLDILNDEDYFKNRMMAIQSLSPQKSSEESVQQ